MKVLRKSYKPSKYYENHINLQDIKTIIQKWRYEENHKKHEYIKKETYKSWKY